MPSFPPSIWWPRATRRPVSYVGEAGTFTAAPIGWVLHVVVGDGSPWATFERAPAGTRRFAHLWVAKDGSAEQYAPLTGRSWAQGAGNGTYWSVETEGFPTEPLTIAQVDTLGAWHAWAGVVDRIASRPGDPGIGTHYMGGADWGGHSCPDPAGQEGRGPRSNARAKILRHAAAIRSTGAATPSPVTTTGDDMPLTNDDIRRLWTEEFPGPDGRPTDGASVLMTAVWGAQWREVVAGKEVPVSAGARLARAAAAPPSVEEIVSAVVAKVPSAGTIATAQIRQALIDVLHSTQ